MRCSAVLLVCLLLTSVPRSEGSKKLIEKIKNFFYPTTTSIPILPEYESPIGLDANTDKNLNTVTQPQEYNSDYSVNYFTTVPSTYEVTSVHIHRPMFPTIIPPPGAPIYPGMPTTTVSTSYTHQLRPDYPSSAIPADNVPPSGQQSTTAFNNRVVPGEPSNQIDDDALVFPDSPSYGPNKERDTGFERANPSNQATTVRSSRVHVPVPVDGTRRVLNGPAKTCEDGQKLDNAGRCRTPSRK